MIFYTMFLVILFCIWIQIRGHLEQLSIIWGTFCIVFIQVVVIHFYPKSFNFISVFSLFSEKSCKLEKTRHHMKDRWYEVWRSMVLKRFLKTIQVWEYSSQVPRHFKTKERSKKIWKTAKIASELLAHAPLRMRQPWLLPYAPLRVYPYAMLIGVDKNCCLLIFRAGLVKKVQFSSLNP